MSISKIYNVPTKTSSTNDNLEKPSMKSVKECTTFSNADLFEGENKRSGIAYTCTIYADMFGRSPNLVFLSLWQHFRTP